MRKFEYLVTVPSYIGFCKKDGIYQLVNVLSKSGIYIRSMDMTDVKTLVADKEFCERLKSIIKSISKSHNGFELEKICRKFFKEIDNFLDPKLPKFLEDVRVLIKPGNGIRHCKKLTLRNIKTIRYPDLVSSVEGAFSYSETFIQTVQLTESQDRILVSNFRNTLIKDVKRVTFEILLLSGLPLVAKFKLLYKYTQLLNFLGWEGTNMGSNP